MIEEPCKVEHSRFSNFLTFFNDYVIFLDWLIHFFVGQAAGRGHADRGHGVGPVGRLPALHSHQVRRPQTRQLGQHDPTPVTRAATWLFIIGSLPIDTV